MQAIEARAKIEIDHWLPRKKGNGWPKFSTDTHKLLHNKLGNLALVDKSINCKYGNKPEAEKRKDFTDNAKLKFISTEDIMQHQGAACHCPTQAWHCNTCSCSCSLCRTALPTHT